MMKTRLTKTKKAKMRIFYFKIWFKNIKVTINKIFIL